jgi:hypothetical protein
MAPLSDGTVLHLDVKPPPLHPVVARSTQAILIEHHVGGTHLEDQSAICANNKCDDS